MSPQRKQRSSDPIAEAKRQWAAHGWEHAAPGMATVVSVVRVHQLMMSRIEQELKPFGITFSRFELLALLMFSSSRALPMSKVSARLQVHPASVTNTVDRLVRDGLVERRPNPDDGRGQLVGITDQGITLVHGAVEVLNRVFTDLGLDDEERDQLSALCNVYRRAAGDLAD
ncbi:MULTISPECIES: MarR family winged helix-turn-helix transcriptional regulator [unclassified Luteococcus]|uniref:MarR family winged helix-turn-helix transcriptional regulator n=1 Tax=unclassified Luteococcus TaxID=2639923 RepID=UPI00313D3437